MKTKPFSVLLALSFFGLSMSLNTVQAQQRPVYQSTKNIIKKTNLDTIARKSILSFYPTNFVTQNLKAGYEFRLSDKAGLKILGSFGSASDGNGFYGLGKFTEFSLEAQLRFYVMKNHPCLNGLYMAPYVSYKYMVYSGDSSYNNVYGYLAYPSIDLVNEKVSNLSIGYILGYQWIFRSAFVVDAFIGGGDNFISGNNGGGFIGSSLFAYRSGIDLHTGIGIGFAF